MFRSFLSCAAAVFGFLRQISALSGLVICVLIVYRIVYQQLVSITLRLFILFA